MWYYEELQMTGRWGPVKAPERPRERTAEGRKIKIRNLRELDETTATWPLDALQEMFNGADGTGETKCSPETTPN